MECSAMASTGVLHRSNVMSKFGSSGISRVRIGVKRKQRSAVRRSALIKAAHCEYASPLRSSSLSSLYDVLCVSPNVSEREIKSAYRRMALKYHPDVCPPSQKEECTTKFLQIQQAYDTLADPLIRQDYDWRLQNRMELGEEEGRFDSSNSYIWEAQLMELIRRRSSANIKNSSSWGSTMRNRNQHMPTAAA